MNKSVQSVDQLRQQLRKPGYMRHLFACAVELDGDKIVFDKDSDCWKQRKKFRFRPSQRIAPPGSWLRALAFTLTLGLSARCGACSHRAALMDAAGWLWIWRVVLLRSFWTGKVESYTGCSGCGEPKRVESEDTAVAA